MNWNLLSELREAFLSESLSARSDYWASQEILEHYDRTFAQRIRWKWESVYKELKIRGWILPTRKMTLLDWGCGTGIASRSFLKSFGVDSVAGIYLHDRSKSSFEFSRKVIETEFPGVKPSDMETNFDSTQPFILLISHVLNELHEGGLKELLKLAERAEVVFWIEPGTHEVSRRLIVQREKLISKFNAIAPCTHSAPCGMLSPENSPHWCHHFADIPQNVFHDAFWSEFSRKLKIDLRHLPLSFLVLQKKDAAETVSSNQSRVIGRPRLYKGNGKFLLCNKTGVQDTLIHQKKQPELFERHEKNVFCSIID